VLLETAKETLLEVYINCLTMVKTNGLNSLTEVEDKEGFEGDSSAAVAT
jgi:hypothetical protein